MRPKGRFYRAFFSCAEDRGCMVVAFAIGVPRLIEPTSTAAMRIAVEPSVKLYRFSHN